MANTYTGRRIQAPSVWDQSVCICGEWFSLRDFRNGFLIVGGGLLAIRAFAYVCCLVCGVA